MPAALLLAEWEFSIIDDISLYEAIPSGPIIATEMPARIAAVAKQYPSALHCLWTMSQMGKSGNSGGFKAIIPIQNPVLTCEPEQIPDTIIAPTKSITKENWFWRNPA